MSGDNPGGHSTPGIFQPRSSEMLFLIPKLARAHAACLTLLLSLIAGRLPAANTTTTGGSQPLPLGQPVLGLRYMIATQGIFPSNGGGTHAAGGVPILGEIRLYAFSATGVPGGWADCDGRLLAISSNNALFSLLGTNYGGNGINNFALPDLRGRIVVGNGSVTGSGLTDHPLAEQFGSVTANLTTPNLPSHLHAMAGAQTGLTGGGTAFPLWRPSLALSPIISPNGTYGVYEDLPEIRLFAGNFQPDTWVYADGRLLPIASYTAMYATIGTVYGGDGINNFRLPPLLGRAGFGAGQGPGLPNYDLGVPTGAETQTLLTAQLPGHTHSTAAGSTGVTGGSAAIGLLQPTLPIRYMIAIYGIYPSSGSSFSGTPLIGEIRPFAGNTPPSNFMFCEGQLLAIAENDTLFTLIGTTFGGDGSSTFALPDLRGRVPVGIGTGPGLPAIQLGETQGYESSPMTVAQMPAHLHAQPSPALTVRGNGTVIVNGDTTPSFADFTEFPPTDVSAGAVSRSFTVSNGGLGDLTLSSSLSGNAVFTIQTAPAAVVLPGASTTLQISFDPTSQSVYSATATLTSDDPGNSSFSFKVGGNGAYNLAGRYPGAASTNSLRVKKNTSLSGYIDLSWGDSCGYAAGYTSGYALYEGQLGNFTSHVSLPAYCDYFAPSATFVLPAAGSRYYLVSAVDRYTFKEGSLGQSSAGVESVHPAGACEPFIDLTSCP